jgi:hypothetical protein
MENSDDDIVCMLQGYSISGNRLVRNSTPPEKPSQHHGQETVRSARRLLAQLWETSSGLAQSATDISSQAQAVRSLTADPNASASLSVYELCSLREQVKVLRTIISNTKTTANVLAEVTEQSIISQLQSFGGMSVPVIKLFAHFDKEIKNIVRKIPKTTDDQTILWRTAEECYKQATAIGGSLYADNYFERLDEDSPDEPYDSSNSGSESEGYCEQVCAEAQRESEARREARSEARPKYEKSWVNFWYRVLHSISGGPTLFHATAGKNAKFFGFGVDVPKLLFRTFDDASSGQSNATTIASITSTMGEPTSRIYIGRLTEELAMHMLHGHLANSCFRGKVHDNLMSWTSSFLFAIQYAFYRLPYNGHNMSKVKLCVVDTGNYPKGQFMRDLALIKAYYNTAVNAEDTQAHNFFNLRLQDQRYYNGEYLSQGAVNIAGRSHVVSLEDLVQAGLFRLYPEFDRPSSKVQ